jgi:hypothetical protein
MIAFTHLTRCIQITRDDIIDATESRSACKHFLERAAAISQPKDGGPLLLLLFSRLATLACEWLDGDLRIELGSHGEETILDVQVSLGLGSAERVFPRLTLKVPFAEFLGAIERVPQVVWPLRMKKGSKRMLLSASRDVRTSTVPPSIEIDIECQSQTIPKAPPLPLAVDTPTVTFLEAPMRGAPDGSSASTIVRIRHTIPYGCELLTGTR